MTPEEMVALARRLLAGEISAADLEGCPNLTEQEKRNVFGLALYEIRRRMARRGECRKAQRRALALLRTFLTAEQRAMLKRQRAFLIVGSLGNTYRLCPVGAAALRVARHGKRIFAEQVYCLHDPENALPPADTTIAHLLLLTADEPAFLAMANARYNDQLWNGEYLRRMAAARRERQAAAAQRLAG